MESKSSSQRRAPHPLPSPTGEPVWSKGLLRTFSREHLAERTLVVVANREPYLHFHGGGEVRVERPTSGMALALDPVMQAAGGIWVAHGSGDADRLVVDAHDHVPVPPEHPTYTLRRVWLDADEIEGYYYGFANEGLWPLCHIAYTRPVFNADHWNWYLKVNEKFARAVAQEIGEAPALVFLQDYHFALLPRMVKELCPNAMVAQFWHIPWPNSEAFRICPWSAEILDGMLGNDLLGFHIQHHCHNFLDAVDRTLESRTDYQRMRVMRGGKTTHVRPFPIGIDFDGTHASAASPEVDAEIERLKAEFDIQGDLIGVGIDRIDYTKGIPERLRAIELVLARRPDLARRFQFVQIGVPSRTLIGVYKRLSDEIQSLIERINRKYAKAGWRPIVYINRHCPPRTMQALDRMSRFCLVSALHDGMNLVAKEFVASRFDEDGVLILSKFAGAAWELEDALLVNPYSLEEIAASMIRAVEMPKRERRRRMRRLRLHVSSNNIYRWAGDILSELSRLECSEVD